MPAKASSSRQVEVYSDPDNNTTFVQIPSHMEFILLQLLQNAIQNHVERYGTDAVGSGEAPPVRVVVADGPKCDHITFRVTDMGRGAPRSQIPKFWSYLHDHSGPQWVGGDSENVYGLPLAKLTAEYFGGHMQLVSLEGTGTTGYVHLLKMTEKSAHTEQLPSGEVANRHYLL